MVRNVVTNLAAYQLSLRNAASATKFRDHKCSCRDSRLLVLVFGQGGPLLTMSKSTEATEASISPTKLKNMAQNDSVPIEFAQRVRALQTVLRRSTFHNME